jgi:hypothetical protein
MAELQHQVPMPTQEDLARIKAVVNRVGGTNVSWGAQSILDVFVVEHRLRADQEASARLSKATWALAWATVGLVVATVALLIATVVN